PLPIRRIVRKRGSARAFREGRNRRGVAGGVRAQAPSLRRAAARVLTLRRRIERNQSSAMNDETAVLVTKARAGDREAFGELSNRYFGKLKLFFAARLGTTLRGRVDADDLVQETLLRAFRDLQQFNPRDGGSFYAWLVVLARNLLIDVGRAARAR